MRIKKISQPNLLPHHHHCQRLVYCLRMVGLNPTEVEIKDMVNQVDETDLGRFDFPAFLTLINEILAETDTEEELFKNTFRAFTKDNEGLKSSSVR